MFTFLMISQNWVSSGFLHQRSYKGQECYTGVADIYITSNLLCCTGPRNFRGNWYHGFHWRPHPHIITKAFVLEQHISLYRASLGTAWICSDCTRCLTDQWKLWPAGESWSLAGNQGKWLEKSNCINAGGGLGICIFRVNTNPEGPRAHPFSLSTVFFWWVYMGESWMI